MAIHLAGKHRAGLIRIAANGDDGFDLVIEEQIHVFGMVSRSVDPDFFQRTDREGMNVSRRFRTGAFDTEFFTKGFTKDGFGKMRAAGVSGAENEDGGWFHGVGSDL